MTLSQCCEPRGREREGGGVWGEGVALACARHCLDRRQQGKNHFLWKLPQIHSVQDQNEAHTVQPRSYIKLNVSTVAAASDTCIFIQ